MAAIQTIPLVNPTAGSQGEYHYNFYFDNESEDGKPQFIGRPGLKLWTQSSTNGRVRNMTKFNGSLFAVVGNKLYKYTTDGAETAITGTLNTSDGYVWLLANNTYLGVCDGSNAYYIKFDADTTLVELGASNNFTITPTSMTILNQQWICTISGDDGFIVSNTNDITEWGTYSTISAEREPDNLVAILADNAELIAAGETGTEMFYKATTDPPYSRIDGVFMKKGCAAAASLHGIDNTAFWLSDNRQVVMVSGYTPQIVSTRKMDTEIFDYTTVSDAVAYSVNWKGHFWYILTFPTEGKTWVFDVYTQLWHKLSSTAAEGVYRGCCYEFFNDKHLVGDISNGKIYEMDSDTYTDGGETIIGQVDYPTTEAQRMRLAHKRLEIEIKAGVGLVDGQGSDPLYMMSYSDNDGRTYSNERVGSLGKLGELEARLFWKQLGRSRSRKYRLRISDPVERIIYATFLTLEAGKV